MKSIKNYKNLLVAGTLLLGMGMTSCDDYLTVLPTAQITEEDFWKDKSDLDNVRSGAYLKMTQLTGSQLYWSELRSDNFVQNDMSNSNVLYLTTGVLKPTDGNFSWGGYYSGINYCNKVLEHGERMTVEGEEVDPSFRRGDWMPIKAEMIALRALYYFNLVKAFRNVPYVTQSISTDAEALAGRIGTTQGVEILGDLVKQLEEVSEQATNRYTTKKEQKGRFTRRAIHALLADIYLWRGCMLNNSVAKGDSIAADSTGVFLTQAELTKMSTECFKNAIKHSDIVLNDIRKEYDEDIAAYPNYHLDIDQNEDYPYMSYVSSRSTKDVSDDIYHDIFSIKNATYESIFELQYDGVNTINSAIGSYMGSYSNNSLNAGTMKGASFMCTDAINPEKGFGKTDIRLLETYAYDGKAGNQQLYHKNVVGSIIVKDVEDMKEGASYSSYRNSGSQDANWPVYRLADVMFIQAEAIARTVSSTSKAVAADVQKEILDANNQRDVLSLSDGEKLAEAFRMVNAFFIRSNPALVTTQVGGEFACDRLNENYAVDKNREALLQLIYAERQREFVGEAKRWYDIVRQAEYQNDNEVVLSSFISLPKTTVNRLKNLWSLYVPIHSDEMNINGVDNGGKLVQNPVWDRYTVK